MFFDVCILDKLDQEPGYRIRKWKLISLVSQSNKNSTLKCKHMIHPKKKRGQVSKPNPKKCGRRAVYWIPNGGPRGGPIGYCKIHNLKSSDDNFSKVEKYVTCRNISDLELVENLNQALEEFPELWEDCTEIFLEAQIRAEMKKIVNLIIGTIANEKKNYPNSPLMDIRVVKATHKLNISDENLYGITLPEITNNGGNKKTYEGRKTLGEEHCKILLSQHSYYYDFFMKQKKKDDLADAFLQGLYFLQKN